MEERDDRLTIEQVHLRRKIIEQYVEQHPDLNGEQLTAFIEQLTRQIITEDTELSGETIMQLEDQEYDFFKGMREGKFTLGEAYALYGDPITIPLTQLGNPNISYAIIIHEWEDDTIDKLLELFKATSMEELKKPQTDEDPGLN